MRGTSAAQNRNLLLSDRDGKVSRLVDDISGSLWYHWFNIGMKYRMGCIWKPNKGFLTQLSIEMLIQTEADKKNCTKFTEKTLCWCLYVMQLSAMC